VVEPDDWLKATELDSHALAALRQTIEADNSQKAQPTPRSLTGLVTHPLPLPPERKFPSVEQTLKDRRSHRVFTSAFPGRVDLARIVWFAHGVIAEAARGPTPSAGGLSSLELYLGTWRSDWLPEGLFHYDRSGHHLAQLETKLDHSQWRALVPSLEPIEGGAVLFFLVGDLARIGKRYGTRGARMLLLEAGHLMQNLCLISASLAWSVLPLGLYLEAPLGQALCLGPSDRLLYLGLLGQPLGSAPR